MLHVVLVRLSIGEGLAGKRFMELWISLCFYKQCFIRLG